jgi:hypothetical protein
MQPLDTTSYSDTSDLVNLFVISRITDESFLNQLFAIKNNNGINQLFSRGNVSAFNNARRIDGDLAQSMSINSEFGVIPFSPEFYEVSSTTVNPPVVVIGSLNYPTMGIFFSSTTEDLQLKDFLSPGRINFRPTNNSTYATYPYGIKSQVVPFYQWSLYNTTTIFGSEKNDWSTSTGDIVQNLRYQSTDRTNRTSPTYFQSNTSPSYTDIYERGYIFSVDNTGNYFSGGVVTNKFIVGAPFHFYFGVVKGDSALDKFKIKYGINE